ncbi:MAG: twin-arginine translocation signal domain-containing protein [Clostridia bacterium]|nr:MAG: twin-arginine translocation signal domain-containing protein [Clostridia bacterium]
MRVSRRTFVKGSAAAVGGLALSQYLNGFELLKPRGAQAAPAVAEDWFPSACWIGKQDCGLLARRINGRVVKLEGHPDDPRNRGRLCPKGQAQIMALYDYNRAKTPLIRTNEKGIAGKWRPASWDEALALAGEKIKEARARNPELVAWQKGRSKAGSFYDEAFVKAAGALKLHHGAFCSDAGYRAGEYTVGPSGVLHPDFRHTKYVLAWGWNITNSGGNKLCWITYPRELIMAKERGMKVVAIDPRLRGAGPFADEWLPIRPGTDLALALALANALVGEDRIDREFLKKYTNAPFLVKDDGFFLRIDGKEQVWDAASGSAKPFDAAGIDPALEGEFTVGEAKVKTAFQVFREHLAQYTPEWAAGVCGVPAEKIRKVARELGENAAIGQTIVVDGVELPYRPVAIHAYHVSQQELGFQAVRAMILLMMLLGAVEAVGGQRVDFTWKPHENFEKLDQAKVKDPPYNIYLKDSKFYPINSNNSSVAARVMLEPEKYGVTTIPEVLIIHMTNPLLAFGDQEALIKAYKKFKFVVAIDTWLSETADYFADVVLPAAAMEKYEGPIGLATGYEDGKALRLPLMEPLFQSKGEIDIYLDLCEKAGILYGKDGYLDQLNKALKLKDEYKLDANTRPAVRDIFDRWAKSEGFAEGIRYFEEKGVKVSQVPASKRYGLAASPPFSGKRLRLYGESLLRLQEEMKGKKVEQIYWQDYTPLPVWRKPTMDLSGPEYDLYLISFKKIEYKQSRAHVPLLIELAPEQYVEINPQAAGARGIKDGEEVYVESHNAVTGETRRVRVKARYVEGIRPDTVGLSHHYGLWTNPWAKDRGPTPNTLFFSTAGYVTNTADQSFHVKVRVYK